MFLHCSVILKLNFFQEYHQCPNPDPARSSSMCSVTVSLHLLSGLPRLLFFLGLYAVNSSSIIFHSYAMLSISALILFKYDDR